MVLTVFGGGGSIAVGGACFGTRRRRLLRLRAQTFADLVALDLVLKQRKLQGGRRCCRWPIWSCFGEALADFWWQ